MPLGDRKGSGQDHAAHDGARDGDRRTASFAGPAQVVAFGWPRFTGKMAGNDDMQQAPTASGSRIHAVLVILSALPVPEAFAFVAIFGSAERRRSFAERDAQPRGCR